MNEPDARYVVVGYAPAMSDEDIEDPVGGLMYEEGGRLVAYASRKAAEADDLAACVMPVCVPVGPVPRVEPVAWGVVEREASGRIVRMALNELWPSRAAFIESGRTYNVRPGYTYTVEPVGASPVASAESEYVEVTCVGCDRTGEMPVDGDTLDISDIKGWTFTSDTGWRCVCCSGEPDSNDELASAPEEEREPKGPLAGDWDELIQLVMAGYVEEAGQKAKAMAGRALRATPTEEQTDG